MSPSYSTFAGPLFLRVPDLPQAVPPLSVRPEAASEYADRPDDPLRHWGQVGGLDLETHVLCKRAAQALPPR